MKIVLSRELPARPPRPTFGSLKPGDCFVTTRSGTVYMVVDAWASAASAPLSELASPRYAGRQVAIRLDTGTLRYLPPSLAVIPVVARVVIDPPATLPERPVVDSPFYNPR